MPLRVIYVLSPKCCSCGFNDFLCCPMALCLPPTLPPNVKSWRRPCAVDKIHAKSGCIRQRRYSVVLRSVSAEPDALWKPLLPFKLNADLRGRGDLGEPIFDIVERKRSVGERIRCIGFFFRYNQRGSGRSRRWVDRSSHALFWCCNLIYCDN
jgi:hypothetical protein